MATIKLQILAEDILKSNYFNSDDCAITRALARAGYPEYSDIGNEISSDEGEKIIGDENETYQSLIMKVQRLYGLDGKKRENPIEDFEHELIY